MFLSLLFGAAQALHCLLKQMRENIEKKGKVHPFGTLVSILAHGAQVADGNVQFYEILRRKPIGRPPSRSVSFQDVEFFSALRKATVGKIADSFKKIRLKDFRAELPGFGLHGLGHFENCPVSGSSSFVDPGGVEGGEKSKHHQGALERTFFEHIFRKPQSPVSLIPFGRAGAEKALHIPVPRFSPLPDIFPFQFVEREHPILFPGRKGSVSALPEHTPPGLKAFHGIIQALSGAATELFKNFSGFFVYGEITVVGHGLGGDGGGVIVPDIPNFVASIGRIALFLMDVRKGGISVQKYVDGRYEGSRTHAFVVFSHMGLPAEAEEKRVDLADGSRVEGGESFQSTGENGLRIDASEKLQPLFLLQTGEMPHCPEHAQRIILLVGDKKNSHICLKFFRMFRSLGKKYRGGGHAGFHIRNAPAEEPFSRFQIPSSLLGKRLCGHGFGAFFRGKGEIFKRAVDICIYHIHMPREKHRFRRPFSGPHKSQGNVPLQGVSLHGKELQILGMFPEVGKLAKPIMEKSGNTVFFRSCGTDAGYGHELYKKIVKGMRF
jgi:hypothetical protein